MIIIIIIIIIKSPRGEVSGNRSEYSGIAGFEVLPLLRPSVILLSPSRNIQRYTSNKVTPLNAELNPIYHLLTLLGAHHILHVSRMRVNPLNTELNPICQ